MTGITPESHPRLGSGEQAHTPFFRDPQLPCLLPHNPTKVTYRELSIALSWQESPVASMPLPQVMFLIIWVWVIWIGQIP